MHPPIIDRKDAIELFVDLVQPDSPQRVLRLLGEAKMGKSHLVAKVYPRLAQQQGARCAVLDLRTQTQSIPDILDAACSLLGGDFPAYKTAYREWLNRPKVEVKGLLAFLSSLSFSAKEGQEDATRQHNFLTTRFVVDLQRLNDQPVVLLFDAVNNAAPETQDWLISRLLVQLFPLKHVRVVVAGRQVPEPLGSYVPVCHSFELCAVTAEEEYVMYCQSMGVVLQEQSIRDLAKALDHTPGQFVDLVLRKFGPGAVTHA